MLVYYSVHPPSITDVHQNWGTCVPPDVANLQLPSSLAMLEGAGGTGSLKTAGGRLSPNPFRTSWFCGSEPYPIMAQTYQMWQVGQSADVRMTQSVWVLWSPQVGASGNWVGLAKFPRLQLSCSSAAGWQGQSLFSFAKASSAAQFKAPNCALAAASTCPIPDIRWAWFGEHGVASQLRKATDWCFWASAQHGGGN